jgi:hypothetical protein
MNIKEDAFVDLDRILDHVSGDLEGGDERPQLDLLARAAQQTVLQFGQLDLREVKKELIKFDVKIS